MKLKTAIFYQSVKNWDGNESNTFKEMPNQIIELEDYLVKVSMEGKKEVIIVPTANLRYAVADYQEAFYLIPKPVDVPSIDNEFEKFQEKQAERAEIAKDQTLIVSPEVHKELEKEIKC